VGSAACISPSRTRPRGARRCGSAPAPGGRLPRCTVHLERNVLAGAPQRLRGRVARDVSRIFDAPSAAEARHRLEQLKLGLGKQLPESVGCLDGGFTAATQFYAFPRPAGAASARPTDSSACTAKSSGASAPSAPSRTAAVRSGSSPPSRCTSRRSGATGGSSTCARRSPAKRPSQLRGAPARDYTKFGT
jgi:hypothetical protein